MKLLCCILSLFLHACCAQEPNRPRNCLDIQISTENNGSGHYAIYPQELPMFVWCDMVSGGGGWTVFQRRFDGSIDFYQDWAAYKRGFGNANGGEFWLGNDNIHALTTSTLMELRVDLEGHSMRRFAEYSFFSIGGENKKYMSTIQGYKPYSTAGDSLDYHSWRPFTTKDRDNDSYGANCATAIGGAWWYGGCHYANLNGRYAYTPNGDTVRHYGGTDPRVLSYDAFDSRAHNHVIKAVSMKVRPVDSNTCRVKEGESFPFGLCSATCGQGVRSRVFVCTFPNSGTRRVVHETEACESGVPCLDAA